jgi:hypothetical protein
MVEVAHYHPTVLVAYHFVAAGEQGAHDGHQRRHAGGRGNHLHGNDGEHVCQIGKLRLARVVLLIGVGDERGRGMQRQIPTHAADTVRIERQHILQHQNGESDQCNDQMQFEHGRAIVAPAHGHGRIDTGQPIQRRLDRCEPPIQRTRPGCVDPRQVKPQRPGQQQRQTVNDQHLVHSRSPSSMNRKHSPNMADRIRTPTSAMVRISPAAESRRSDTPPGQWRAPARPA